jgi:hypothetical protein
MDRAKIKKYLEQATSNVEKAESLIRRQRNRINQLVKHGRKTENAERSLKSFLEVEEIIERSRDIVLKEVQRHLGA